VLQGGPAVQGLLPEGSRRESLLEAAPVPTIDYRGKALELAGKDPATASLVLKGWLAEAAAPKV
jgi:hypothetical protein